ncbi:AEC family transporter [Streptomyces sp. NP160]|uniref:AEC family transporter n=1 Tax=Streptomyces sp. NP160 TaxID=2586637 RepID=UPI001119B92B|nr:AEC family transporter [Streptomyces sp. NP160]TNM70169.1 AEC family transporter [Streptomyces sp. NP160]
MGGVLAGFATIIALIALGTLLAQLRVLDLEAQRVLSRLAFYVASPALMVVTLAGADVHQVLSANLVASAAAFAVTAGLYVLASRLAFRHDLARTTVGALSAAYVNAGNLGLPIAAYVLGDAALVAPTWLLQLLVLQPLALVLLDVGVSERRPPLRSVLLRPLSTPLTVGSLVGLALSLTGARVPSLLADPLELVAGMAVPAMLIAYGISLRLGPRPGTGGGAAELTVITALKVVVMPATAYLVGRFALGMEGAPLLAVTVLAALPTAQNIFVHATRYDRGVVVSRDAIFATTALSVPVIATIAALLTP